MALLLSRLLAQAPRCAPSGAGAATGSAGAGKTLYQYIAQVKREETPLLGSRTHPQGSSDNCRYLLEQDLLGFGLNERCTLAGTMIEFLQVLLCQPPGEAFALPAKQVPAFVRTRHVLLRALVFNNPQARPINARGDLSEEHKWELWHQSFRAANEWAERLDLDYLRTNFKDFHTFVTALRLLQNWTLDVSETWTERFLIPCGPYTCYWPLNQDLSPVNTSLSGSGQLLYHALRWATQPESIAALKRWAQTAHERSLYPELGITLDASAWPAQLAALSQDVGTQLYTRFLGQPNIFNRCAAQIEGPYAVAESELCQYVAMHAPQLARKAGAQQFEQFRAAQETTWPVGQVAVDQLNYLNFCPLRGHRIFVQLLGDYANILAQSLSAQDLFAALGTITLLNFIVLGLEQSAGAFALYPNEKPVDINIIPAINTSPKDRMRKLALTRCKANSELHGEMLPRYGVAHLRKLLNAINPKFINIRVLKLPQLKELLNCIYTLYNFNATAQRELLHFLPVWLAESKAEKSAEKGAKRAAPERTARAASTARAATAAESADECLERIVALRVSYREVELALMVFFKKQRSFDNAYHRVLGRQIGLITTELTTGHCYILSDQLVTTLVMAVLGRSKHLPWADFLTALAERYHIIVGVKAARAYYAKGGRYYGITRISDLDEEFRKNERALRIKLERMGLLLVLSDGCDFVKNPFFAPGAAPGRPLKAVGASPPQALL